LNKQSISASIDPQNEKSINLFERLGFQKQDQSKRILATRSEWPDDLVFTLNREEWLRI
jgi:RimJ/RimL family protein N-acetyltransferase